MRFTFRSTGNSDSGGLPIIREIPDIRLAQLEGKNGIGKTLAARLLELVSGQQPFAALPRAWDSLVNLLGAVEITIEGAPEGVIVVSLDSAEWVGRSQAECAANPGLVTVAGQPATWPTVRSIVQIRRVAGDEGLAETLGRTLREYSVTAERERRELVPIVMEWSNRLDALRELTTVASPDALQQLRDVSEEAGKALDAAERSAIAAVENAAMVTQRKTLASDLLAAAEAIPSLLAQYEELLELHRAARERTTELEQDLTKAGAAQVHNARRQADIRTWTRRLDIRRTALTRARLRERQLLVYLGFDSRPEPDQLDDMKRSVHDELQELESRLRTADMAGTIRNVATDIEGSLATIPSSAMDEVIAELERPVSAGELLTGIRVRRSALREVPRPGEAVELERRIGRLRERSRRLLDLPDFIDTADRKVANVREAEEKLSTLLALTSDQRLARDAIEQDLATQREVLVSASTDAVRVLGTIQAFVAADALAEDGQTSSIAGDVVEEQAEDQDEAAYEAAEEALESAVRQILRPATAVATEVATWFDEEASELANSTEGVAHVRWGQSETVQELSELVQTLIEGGVAADKELALKSARRVELEAIREHTRMALHSERLSIASAIAALTDDTGDWSDFAPACLGALSAFDLPVETLTLSSEGFVGAGLDRPGQLDVEAAAAGALQLIASIAEDIEDAASTVRDGWGTASAYLGKETKRLAPRLAAEDSWDLSTFAARGAAPVLQTWTQNVISLILSADALRNQLFDGTDKVTFDLDQLAVSWRTPDGRRRRRPLEAFSSGEQVFAYTRAKLETFRPIRESTGFIVVFLDEFGAFVARDRFSELLRYVQEEALGDIADQIVVMLPLSAPDLGQALASRAMRPRDEQRALLGEGYFVVSAEPERVS